LKFPFSQNLREAFLTGRENLTEGVFWVLELHSYLPGLEHIDLSVQEGSVVLVGLIVSSGLRGREPVMGLALEAKEEAV